MNTTEIIAAAVMLASVSVVAAIAVAGRRSPTLDAANSASEHNPAKVPPTCAKAICAWCHPGIDHPAGHTICPAHSAEMERAAEELSAELTERRVAAETRNFAAE